MKQILSLIVLLNLIFVFSSCNAIKEKFDYLTKESKEAYTNITNKVTETTEDVSNAASQVKTAVGSVQKASEQANQALEDLTKATESVQAIGGDDDNEK
jgi:methyl-accepting chemotaxis protein